MSWQEITLSNLTLLSDFVDIQKSCSDYYASFSNSDIFILAFNKIPSFRMFIWKDDNYNLIFSTLLRNKDMTVEITTLGMKKIIDMNVAVEEILSKIKLLMEEYQAKKIYAKWADDGNHPEVIRYYMEISSKSYNYGFTNIVLSQPKDHIYVFTGDYEPSGNE